jgi:O-antigen ligase
MLLISGALAVSYVPDTVVQRLATTGESVESLSLGGRFKLWQAGMNIFPESPVLGHGTASYKHAITPQLGMLAQTAHNSYLSVMVEEGIVGLLLFLAMLASAFFAVIRLPRLERRFALVLLATVCVAMLPLTWEDQKPVWLVLAMLIGLSHAAGPAFGSAPRHQMPRQAVAGFPRPNRPRPPLTPVQRVSNTDPSA